MILQCYIAYKMAIQSFSSLLKHSLPCIIRFLPSYTAHVNFALTCTCWAQDGGKYKTETNSLFPLHLTGMTGSGVSWEGEITGGRGG